MNIENNALAFIGLYRELQPDVGTLVNIGSEVPEGVSIAAYSEFYNASLQALGAFLFQQTDVLDGVKEAASEDDPNAAIIEFARSVELDFELESDQALVTLVAMRAMMVNMISITLFHLPIAGLLENVSKGDDDSLFRAVVLDACVLDSKPVADRIATASFRNDRSFFDRLSKAITQTKPARPKAHLDELRLLMQILDDAGVLGSMTDADLTEWAVNKIGVYPDKGDALQAVRRQRRARDAAKCQ